MRVGLTLYGSLAEHSGGFRYDRKLVEGLRAAGDTVDVVELPWRSYHRGLLDSLDPRVRDRLAVDVDVMLQDELAHPSLTGHTAALPYPTVSIVHHLRASEPRRLRPLYRAIERRYLSTVDGVVCNSGPTRRSVQALAPGTRAVVAPPAGDRLDSPADPDQRPLPGPDQPLRVVFVGNITPRKGLDTLVDGMAASETTVELTVIGQEVDESYVADVRQSVCDHGLADRVTFLGRCPDEELAAQLRNAHVLAVTSRYEGLGIVYLEAMSFGLPVLATRAGGATDVVTHGEDGYLIDPNDPAAVGRALTRFASDPDRFAEMCQAAKQRYERQPDWTETTARVRSMLAEVVA
jgi:glycosyltransferase involved in cell wall biosynthesis